MAEDNKAAEGQKSIFIKTASTELVVAGEGIRLVPAVSVDGVVMADPDDELRLPWWGWVAVFDAIFGSSTLLAKRVEHLPDGVRVGRSWLPEFPKVPDGEKDDVWNDLCAKFGVPDDPVRRVYNVISDGGVTLEQVEGGARGEKLYALRDSTGGPNPFLKGRTPWVLACFVLSDGRTDRETRAVEVDAETKITYSPWWSPFLKVVLETHFSKGDCTTGVDIGPSNTEPSLPLFRLEAQKATPEAAPNATGTTKGGEAPRKEPALPTADPALPPDKEGERSVPPEAPDSEEVFADILRRHGFSPN